MAVLAQTHCRSLWRRSRGTCRSGSSARVHRALATLHWPRVGWPLQRRASAPRRHLGAHAGSNMPSIPGSASCSGRKPGLAASSAPVAPRPRSELQRSCSVIALLSSRFAPRCCLTLRSWGLPPAMHLPAWPSFLSSASRAKAFRRQPLSSNVRPRTCNPVLIAAASKSKAAFPSVGHMCLRGGCALGDQADLDAWRRERWSAPSTNPFANGMPDRRHCLQTCRTPCAVANSDGSSPDVPSDRTTRGYRGTGYPRTNRCGRRRPRSSNRNAFDKPGSTVGAAGTG